MNEITERLNFAIRLALEACWHSMAYFKSTEIGLEFKEDRTPVTRADREAEEMIRDRLLSECPDDAVLGEEYGEKTGITGYKWYLDPVDGTESFVRGVPLFGTMIGIEKDNEPQIGVIYFPALKEIIFAAKDEGAKFAIGVDGLNNSFETSPARVSQTASLSDATLSSTDILDFRSLGMYANFSEIMKLIKQYRGWSDCYGHYLVATGRLDAMIDPIMNVWDTAPLLPIIQEAGGKYSDLAGEVSIHTGSSLSSNSLLHEQLLNLLKA